MEEVLERAEGSTDQAGSALGGGRSKAAAYQKLRGLMKSSPAEISKLIESPAPVPGSKAFSVPLELGSSIGASCRASTDRFVKRGHSGAS